MSNFPEISTLGTRPRWIEEISKAFQHQPDTQQLFAHSFSGGDFLIHELTDDEEFSSKLTSRVVNTMVPVEKIMTQPRPGPRRIPRVKRVSTLPEERYILLKKFEGFVTARNERSFTARLFENDSDYPVLEVEIELEELSETDRTLAVEGASVVWTIGYGYEGNTRKRESVIYLRRLPSWQDEEIKHAKQEVGDLIRDISWK